MAFTIGALQLADWRRRVAGLYAGVRQLSVRDAAAGHELWRSGRDELFAGHAMSPLLPDDRARFTGHTVARYDPDWRFELEVRRPTGAPARLTGADGEQLVQIGTVCVPGIGALEVWRIASYGGGLFLPVRDALAGAPGGTAPGGRHLLDTSTGVDLGPGAADDAIVVDFNFAYNPSAVYDPSWPSLPITSGNTLRVEIPVGERMPR